MVRSHFTSKRWKVVIVLKNHEKLVNINFWFFLSKYWLQLEKSNLIISRTIYVEIGLSSSKDESHNTIVGRIPQNGKSFYDCTRELWPMGSHFYVIGLSQETCSGWQFYDNLYDVSTWHSNISARGVVFQVRGHLYVT